MKSVTLNKVNENPFYGMNHALRLYNSADKIKLTEQFLDDCFEETKVKGRIIPERKEMLFSLLFSIGDITARQHNIFEKRNVEKGGHAIRENFRLIMLWMRKKHNLQYTKFLYNNLFNEYTSFDNLFAARVKTQKKTNKILEIIDMLGSKDDMNQLAIFVSNIIKSGNPFDKHLVAKFLTRPRMSKRQGHKRILPETKELMKKKTYFLLKLSELCDFGYKRNKGYINFYGYYDWRKTYNKDLESVLFSTGKIVDFDKEEFLNWIDKIPASARKRVKNRIFLKDINNPKWGDLSAWYSEWENMKESAQKEQRVIEEEIRQNGNTEEMAEKLKKVKKKAKVTTGAINFKDMYSEIVRGTVDTLKIQPFLDKIDLPYNNLVFVDDSGSMGGSYGNTFGFTPLEFGIFIATIMLLKNPDDDARQLLGLFSRTTRMFSGIDKEVVNVSNSILHLSTRNIKRKPLINPELSFIENLESMKKFIMANVTYNGTNISGIPEHLHKWVNGDDAKVEQLMKYPVWTIISDGNFNNMGNPVSSMNDFMYKCQSYFGFKPFIIAIDVASISSAKIEQFSGIENFMFIPPNPANIEQLLTNFNDIDIMDVFTPLLSIYRSNRYELIRKNVL